MGRLPLYLLSHLNYFGTRNIQTSFLNQNIKTLHESKYMSHPFFHILLNNGLNLWRNSKHRISKWILKKYIRTKQNFFFLLLDVKGAATDIRYFARSKFSRSLVHKKNFSVIWQLVFKLGYVFCQER